MPNPNLTALAAYAGKYEKALMAKMYKELALAADGIQVIPGVKSALKLTRLIVGKGIKPYTGKFVSMDDQLKYAERTLTVEKGQRDIEIEPEKYRTTWMSEITPGTQEASNKAIPFSQFTWDTIMKENAEEIVEMLYFGVGKSAFAAYAAGTAYSVGDLIYFNNTNAQNETQYYKCVTATSAGQSPITHPDKWQWAGNLAVNKGYNALIQDAITNEGFDEIASTGAITSTDAYAQFTAVWRKQKEQVKQKGAFVYCSVNAMEMLMDDYENKIKKNFDEVDGIIYLAKTNRKAIVKPVSWLSGSGRLICTPANNLLLGTDALSDLNGIQNIAKHYTLESSLSFVIGGQVRDLDALTINDQE
jgi:hypothetical protein